jgi:signal transduction histidine kinase
VKERRDPASRLPNVAALEPLLRRLACRGTSVPILYVELAQDGAASTSTDARRVRSQAVAAAIKGSLGRFLRRGDRAVSGPGGRWYAALLAGRTSGARCPAWDADLGLVAERLRHAVQAALLRVPGSAPGPLGVRCGWSVLETRPTREPLAALRQALRGAAVVARVEERRALVLSAVTHELRTPLTAICGFAERLSGRGQGVAASRRAAQVIAQEARRLARLAESLIDLGAWHSGGLILRRAPVELGDLARLAVACVADRARHKSVTCTISGGGRIAADRDRLLQALLNVVDNAVRHAPPGSRVRIALKSTSGGCRLTVTDRGPGPAPSVAGRLGQPFVRDGRGKVGLGLAIAKILIEAHGGTLRLTRRRRHTVATMTIPQPTRRYPA